MEIELGTEVYPRSIDVCANCGAGGGLHKSSGHNCPKFGIEETREGHRQQWQDSIFEDAGLKQFYDTAPLLATTLNRSAFRLMKVSDMLTKCADVIEHNCPNQELLLEIRGEIANVKGQIIDAKTALNTALIPNNGQQ